MKNWVYKNDHYKIIKVCYIYLAFFLDPFHVTVKINVFTRKEYTLYSTIQYYSRSHHSMTDKAVTERNYCNIKGGNLFISFLLLKLYITLLITTAPTSKNV